MIGSRFIEEPPLAGADHLAVPVQGIDSLGLEESGLNRIIHDRRYIEDPGRLAEVTKEFVLQTLSETLEAHEINEIQQAKLQEAKTYRFSWPDMEGDFPYRDEEE